MTSFISSAMLALAAFATLSDASAAGRERTSTPISVIELFTSQGCSSCPPADLLLRELAQRQDIVALSYPVTYWDYLGWKDTLARPENTRRQRAYALAHGDSQVYTPQAIVNGLEGCVGSDREQIEAALRNTAVEVQTSAVSISAHLDGRRVIVETGAAPAGSKHATGKVWVAAVTRSSAVPIAAGENAGREVTYTNVVRKLIPAGEWQGAPTSYAVPVQNLLKENGDMIVVFLQAGDVGPIVGATRIDG